MDRILLILPFFFFTFLQNLNAQDDKIIGPTSWVHQSSGAIIGGPALDGRAIYFGDDQGILFSIDQKTGAENWKLQVEGGVRSKISFDESSICCLTDSGNLYSVFKKAGRVRWKSKVGDEKQKDL
jgi:outer membrane protein assembly factor BamB